MQLQVASLDRSLAYYEGMLGLQSLDRTEDSVTVGASDGRPLVQLRERVGARPAPKRGAFGLYHFALLLPERAALGRFASHMIERQVPMGAADHLVSEALYLTDPDGLGIEVYADRPRTSWTSRGGELRMASDPLDLRSIVAEAAGLPWSGFPAGTTMGHLHLHVASLDQAEAFYHLALGFDKVVWSYPGALFMSAGGYHHHLAVNTWSPGPSAREDEARLLEWRLHLPTTQDVSAVAQRMGLQGAPVVHDRDDLILADPWGTTLRVLADA